MASRHIWICRHGHREGFVGDTAGGTWRATAKRPHDPGLSPLGHVQARALAGRLRGCGIAHVFCSPFLRTVQTAHAVAEALDLPLRIEHGIYEWLNPEWFASPPAFLEPDELARDYSRIDPSYEPRVRPSYPEPDERTDAWPRVKRTVDALLADYAGDLLLVGHGSSCVGAMHVLTGQTFDARMCSVTRLRLDDGASSWAALETGCVKHLSNSEDALRFH